MSRFELGYLLLAVLVIGVAGALAYLSDRSKRSTWLRGERKRRKQRDKAAGVPAE